MRKYLASAALAIVLAGCHNTASTGGANSNATADNSAAPAAEGAVSYQVDKVPLPGEGRGDYLLVDNDARRLYVTHSTQVHILDADTLKSVGTVTGLKAAHGVALAHGHGFVTDGDSNAVVMFDPATGKTEKMIPAGKKPDSILHDPASDMILAFDGDSEDVSVIDPVKAAVVKTIKLPNGPEFSQTDGKGLVFVNMEEGNDIGVIDTKAMKLDHVIKLDGCDGPAPLAFDGANRRLFSGCGNKVMTVTDADTGKVITRVPIGGDPDGIAFDPDKKRIFVANRDKTWTVIDQKDKDSYTVNQTLPIDEYAKTVALDPKTHRLFTSTADLIWPKPTPGKKLLPNAAPGSFRLLVVSEK